MSEELGVLKKTTVWLELECNVVHCVVSSETLKYTENM